MERYGNRENEASPFSNRKSSGFSSALILFCFCFETDSHHLAQTGLELDCNPVYSAFQVLVSWIDMCYNLSRCWKAEMDGILGALCVLSGLFLCFRNWQAGVIVLCQQPSVCPLALGGADKGQEGKKIPSPSGRSQD